MFQTNMSYHNIDVVIKGLSIFVNEYKIIKCLKLNFKRAVYLCSSNKVLKFFIKTNVTDEQHNIFKFYNNLSHPNFCKINKIFEIDMFYVIDMEYIEGVTMDKYYANYLLPENNDISSVDSYNKHSGIFNNYVIIFDLILALEFIHNKGIIHGDIKPSNIIINKNNKPIIIDYDLGKYVTDELITSKNYFGTYMYISPELLYNYKFNTKTDMWSLGMTFVNCINNNKDIFNYDNINELIKCMIEKKRLYGRLFINLIHVMCTYDMLIRPSSKELVNILKKSKFMKQHYSL